ncbi:Neurexin-2 [Mactra antiquata]
MHLSYSLNNEFNMLTVNTGQGLTNNEWHSVDLVRDGRLTTLKVDQIDNTRKSDNYDLDYEIFGNSRDNYVFIGGLPLEYNQKLSELALPKVVFEPRLQGSVRNIFYSNCGKPLVKAELLDSDGIVLDDNECMKNDPCKNKGICVTKNHGVMCDCTYTDYSGEYCEIASLLSPTGHHCMVDHNSKSSLMYL